MSTFGGDSWVPENLYRKRRVEELLRDEIPEDELRRLSNGRLACLVCPNRPVLDTMPMLQIHRKGARHEASAEKEKLKKQRLHEEMQKQIALGSMAGSSANRSSVFCPHGTTKRVAPLLTSTNKIKAAVLTGQHDFEPANSSPGNALQFDNKLIPYARKKGTTFFEKHIHSPAVDVYPESVQQKCPGLVLNSSKPKCSARPFNQHKQMASDRNTELAYQVAIREIKRELKFKEAGWKQDGVGHWFKDEDVEFDSDEDVPVDNH